MKRLLVPLLILLLLLCACGTAQGNDPATAPEAEAEEEEFEDDVTGNELPILPSWDDTPAESGESDELPILGENALAPDDGVPAPGAGTVTLDGISSYLRVDLPEGWTWEQAGGTADGAACRLHPESDPDFTVELRWWQKGFAMCGTGVSFADYTLPDGRTATLATEEAGESLFWTLILPEAPDSFTVQYTGDKAAFEAHRAELELLLGSIRQGVLAQPNAVTVPTSDA